MWVSRSRGVALLLATLALPAMAAHDDVTAGTAFVTKYCGDCHNATDWAGGVAFDTLPEDNIANDADVWEETVKKLRGRLMPPPGEAQPTQAAIDAQVAWLEGRLDSASITRKQPGNVVLHRLNRIEYQNEIRRLLDLDIDAAALLPKDTKADGFDNVAMALRVSPAFLDAYIVAAQEVSAKALGGNSARATSTLYRASPGIARYQHQEGLPLGTRGGIRIFIRGNQDMTRAALLGLTELRGMACIIVCHGLVAHHDAGRHSGHIQYQVIGTNLLGLSELCLVGGVFTLHIGGRHGDLRGH